MRTLFITHADYVDGYRLDISFSDGTSQIIDFGPFLINHSHPQHNKYRVISNFKLFKIERGNLVWGHDWDLIFPIEQLHEEYVDPAMY